MIYTIKSYLPNGLTLQYHMACCHPGWWPRLILGVNNNLVSCHHLADDLVTMQFAALLADSLIMPFWLRWLHGIPLYIIAYPFLYQGGNARLPRYFVWKLSHIRNWHFIRVYFLKGSENEVPSLSVDFIYGFKVSFDTKGLWFKNYILNLKPDHSFPSPFPPSP